MMVLTSIARPYARAAFDCALAEKKLEAWSALLMRLAQVLQKKVMRDLLSDPRRDKMETYECLLAICEPAIWLSGENFLKLIALNKRFLALPSIASLFERYKLEETKQVKAAAISAVSLTKAEKQVLTDILKQRLQRQIILDYHIDEDLLGGLVVQVGDLVIDSSVRSKLERLRATLVN